MQNDSFDVYRFTRLLYYIYAKIYIFIKEREEEEKATRSRILK